MRSVTSHCIWNRTSEFWIWGDTIANRGFVEILLCFIGREIPVFIFIEMVKGCIFIIVDALLNIICRIAGKRVHQWDWACKPHLCINTMRYQWRESLYGGSPYRFWDHRKCWFMQGNARVWRLGAASGNLPWRCFNVPIEWTMSANGAINTAH